MMTKFFAQINSFTLTLGNEYSNKVKIRIAEIGSMGYHKDLPHTEIMGSILDYLVKTFPDRLADLEQMVSTLQEAELANIKQDIAA